jgi:glutathione S-transferase
MEAHLSKNKWFSGKDLSMADFQMSFPVEAALARSGDGGGFPKLAAYRERMVARPAYLRALAKGGPVLMT